MAKIEDKLNIVLLEKMYINQLLNQTVTLIHSTYVIKAIKKLTQAHDILTLNQEIISKFKEQDKFCWDKAAVQDLSHISKELVVFHRTDFNPDLLVYDYSETVASFVDSLWENERVLNQ